MATKISKKILIAEDDKDLLSLLKENFELEGFDVVTAEDGEAGYELAKKEKPAHTELAFLLFVVFISSLPRMTTPSSVL